MLSLESFKDGVRMANPSILAIKKMADKEEKELAENNIGTLSSSHNDINGDDASMGATSHINMLQQAPSIHAPVDINLMIPNTTPTTTTITTTTTNNIITTASASSDQSSAVINTNDDDANKSESSVVPTAVVSVDVDHPNIYEYLQPKNIRQSSTASATTSTTITKSRNPFYRPNTTTASDPQPHATIDPPMIKDLGLSVKSK